MLKRQLTTSARSMAGSTAKTTSRAIVYAEHGDPAQVLRAHSYQLPKLNKGEVRLKFELAAISKRFRVSCCCAEMGGEADAISRFSGA